MSRVTSLTSIIAVALLLSCVVDGNRPELSTPERVGDNEEYHYTGKFCTDCHVSIPKEGGDKYLKYKGDFNILCKCHLKQPDNYVHPVNIVPSQEKQAKIPTNLPLQDGKVTCLTCHDIYWQCQKRRVDKNSLRGTPISRRSDFCFECHAESEYVMLNPHTQFNPWGKIIVDKCLFCHTEKPDEKIDRYDNVQFVGDLEMICQRCHVIRGNHAGNVNHLVKPSVKALARMQAMEKEFDIILPLDKNGRLTCITCHNPRDKGVIQAKSPAAKGAGSKYRHRLPGRLCVECHQL